MELFLATIVTLSLPVVLYSMFQLLSKFNYSNQNCYMLAYQCYKPPDKLKLSTATALKILIRNQNLNLEDHRYLQKSMVGLGLGEETYCPRSILEQGGRKTTTTSSPTTLEVALQEMDDIVFHTLDRLFAKSGISPSQIDILVTTTSLSAHTPSLTGRIVNRYKMKQGIKSYSLAGMGCTSSIIGIDMARNLLNTQPNAFAIVVSAEAFGSHFYRGSDRSMILPNLFYRTGGTSILLTNNSNYRDQAMLELVALVRTHDPSDESYNCFLKVEDDQGLAGFHVGTLMMEKVARKCLTENFRVLLPKVVPLWETLRFALLLMLSRLGRRRPRRKIMIDMKAGIHHFCLQPTTRATIDGFRTGLGLEERDVEPSRMTLHRFGFTSGSSLWYVLGYMEAKRRLKKGEKVLMVAMGAGYMCNTCVWKVNRDLLQGGGEEEDDDVWGDCIDRYPQPTEVNSFAARLDWVQEDCMNFVRYDDYIRTEFSKL
ncbi:unnamed protein product [Linum trigynum]|uniref:3-ketoacyl-CoA synthase n=1 Tax=Linum trigynum TaxID=586398 RepID=A0AAV2GC85_9ROSI